MDDKIYSMKKDLEEVKKTERIDILHEILNTIDDYETIKTLEENKEKAFQSKENADLRSVGLDIQSNDDNLQRKELKKIGQDIIEINPIMTINLEEERKKEQELIQQFNEERKLNK